MLKLFCGDFHWGVVALSPVEGGVEEECLAVSEKLTMLLAQQLLPMLEKLSPRDTALNLLRKDALILLAEEIKTPLTVASAAAQTVEAKLHYAQQTELEERCRRLLQVLDQNLRKAIRVSDNVDVYKRQALYMVQKCGQRKMRSPQNLSFAGFLWWR